MKRNFAINILIAGLAMSSPASACSIFHPEGYVGSAQQRRDVRAAIETASVIVDGEVVRSWRWDRPALVRVEHVFKGYPAEYIEVGGPGAGVDCSIPLEEGERQRMLLFNGPAPYDLFMAEDPRLVDRYLHSDRRKVWPYRAGKSLNNQN